MRSLLLLVSLFELSFVTADEYYGVYLGKLRNASYALEGHVYLVNTTHLQIQDLNLKRLIDRNRLTFVFQNSKIQKQATEVYEYKISNDGDWLRL
ncbi:hypothetical protein RB195_021657 [Necator americanus]